MFNMFDVYLFHVLCLYFILLILSSGISTQQLECKFSELSLSLSCKQELSWITF